MRKEVLFEMSSPYRDEFRITGYKFGDGENTLAIVGTMRGDEIQQQYICAQLVKSLKQIEKRGEIMEDKSILVIPSCNPFSMNVSRRFWAMDNTDINRMFPGYDLGETTQRIAAAVFSRISDYKYGIQMASFYMPGDFVPHVRMLKTGYEDIEDAKLFGFPYVTVRKPLPFDTTLLNYNWQVWNCKAFSVYSGQTDHINPQLCTQTENAILRFMQETGIIKRTGNQVSGYDSVFVDEDELVNIKANRAGIITQIKEVGDTVYPEDTIARIIDPYDGSVREEVKSPVKGTLFFATNKPLVLQNALLYRIQG